MGSPRLRILLLCDDNPANANTLLDHIESFRRFSRHHVKTFNPRGRERNRSLDFNEFDVVVIHWSLSLIHDHYLHTQLRDRIAAFRGLKVHFLQDDYRWVDRMTAEQRRLGIGVLFTLVSPEHFDKIWTPRLPGVHLVSTLPGYAPQNLLDRPVKPVSDRELDIVYRGREVPWWLGRIGQDKVHIGRGVKALAEKVGFKVDIAWTEGDRIYGERWVEFLANSRTTIGCEGGASITDFDGSIEEAVLRFLSENPDATFEEVHAAILAPYEGNVPMNVMTPRLLEAAALRTGLVLFPGRYSDVLQPWQHYIPLERDFSNFDTVARLIRDDVFLSELTERAYRDVAMSPSFSLRGMVAQFDRVVDEQGRRRVMRPPVGYHVAIAEQRLSASVNRHRGAFARTNLSTKVVAPIRKIVMRTRIGQYPLHYAIKGVAAINATLTSRDRAGLLARSIVPGASGGRHRLDVVLEDMLKLDVLTRRQGRDLVEGMTFHAWPHLHPDGTLELRSMPPGQISSEAADPDAALRALEAGEVTSVVWNHSLVGDRVAPQRHDARGAVTVWFIDGRHEFRSLRPLLRDHPMIAARMLRPALARAAPAAANGFSSRKKPRAVVPRGVPDQLRRLARDPIGYAARAYVMARVIAPNSGYRRLVSRYLSDPKLRSAAPVDAVLGDMLRLDALTRTCRESDGLAVRLRCDVETGEWTYSSAAGRSDETSAQPDWSQTPPTKILWDHSRVADSLEVRSALGRRITVTLGPAGIYSFGWLASVAQLEPELVDAVLPRPAPTGEPVAVSTPRVLPAQPSTGKAGG